MGHARVTVDGRTIRFSGPAQYHEQFQTDPRFTVPFSYTTLWAGDAGMTLLLVPGDSGGYLVTSNRTREVSAVEVSAPGGSRAVALLDADGARKAFDARIRAEYAIHVYGHNWRGAMVSAAFGGRQWLGHINDFRPEDMPYAGLS